jgi:hypothetical protein
VHEPGTKDRQITSRVTQETIGRAERLAVIMQKRPESEPFRMTGSALMRVAVQKGLGQLESRSRS